jgi:protein-S-isoprenylcysteine O-methyltransferase Ste14
LTDELQEFLLRNSVKKVLDFSKGLFNVQIIMTMKAKITSILVFILFAYALPVLGIPALLFTPQMGILVTFAAVLFATQPPLTFSDATADKSSDKNSVVFIMLGYFIGQLATIIEWAYCSGYHKWLWDWRTIAGLTLMAGGTIFRVWCIRTLGKFFTSTVRVQEKQKIITNGAYRVVRHPSYSGAFIAAVGSSVFMHTVFSVIITILVLSIAYHVRIKAEEESLTNRFGEEYRSYCKKTKRLVPHIY